MKSVSTVDSLNAQRRRAVQLRLAGETLAAVSNEVGLSTPTIIAAFKAFQTGGWPAVDVKPRGRRKQSANSTEPAAKLQESVVQTMLNSSGNTLWTTERVQQWLHAEKNTQVSVQTANTYTQQWGLAPPNLNRAARQAVQQNRAGAAQWMEGEFADFVNAAKKHRATVLWIGSVSCHDSHTLLFAQTQRGKSYWQLHPAQPNRQHYLQFVSTLSDVIGAPLALVQPSKELIALFNEDVASLTVATQIQMPSKLISSKAPNKNRQTAKNTTNTTNTTNTKLDATTLSEQSEQDKTMNQTEPTQPIDHLPSAEQQASNDDNIMNQAKQSSSALNPSAETLTHLQRLEAESIHIMREVVAEADNPVMLYSMGKDSAVMLHLARKAFFPAPPPFPLLHVDTTWKFQAMYQFREQLVKDYGVELITHVNPEGLEKDVNPFTHGSELHTNIMKTEALRQALDKHGFDVAFGGARRDEEKSRAKERIFSFRTAQHRWEPKNQRPELWNLFNSRKQSGETIRAFPISNWTELDIWQYIHLQNIPIVPLYFAAQRPVVERDGTLIMVDDERMPLNKDEVPMMRSVRFRTLGCYPLTGAVESTATTLPEIIQEMLLTKTSERQGRMIDHDAAASMEKKKQEGYF